MEKSKKKFSLNILLAIIIGSQVLVGAYIFLMPSPGVKPASVLVLQEKDGKKQIYEMENSVIENYGNSVRVIGENETFVFDASEVVVVKNPTEKTRKRFWDMLLGIE